MLQVVAGRVSHLGKWISITRVDMKTRSGVPETLVASETASAESADSRSFNMTLKVSAAFVTRAAFMLDPHQIS